MNNEIRKFYLDCTICGKRHEVVLSWPPGTEGRRLHKKKWERLKFECIAELYNEHKKLHPLATFPYHDVKIENVRQE